MNTKEPAVLRGHCLCGATRFELVGDHNWVGHCHCESCRRATASPFTTWVGQKNGSWVLTGEQIVRFESSPGNERGFCGECGSPMFFRADRYPNEMHFYAALLENPEAVEPVEHFHSGEMLSWVHLSDGLARK